MDGDSDMSITVGGNPSKHALPPESVDTAISILPKPLIELCNLVSFDYSSVPFPQTATTGKSQALLNDLGWGRVGDLARVSPLMLLSLVEELRSFTSQANDIWQDALSFAQSLTAPVLQSVMAPALAMAFSSSVAHFSDPEARISNTAQSAQYSSFLFEPSDVITACGYGQVFVSPYTYTIWTPEGTSSVDARAYSPQNAPLLSTALQRALATAGCDFSISLARALPLNIRTLRTCNKSGVEALADLVSRTPEQLFEYRNFGPGAYRDVISPLREYLAPWLAKLPVDVLLGGEAPSAEQSSAPGGHTAESADVTPANPFAALRDSDLMTVLDLYGVSWRDLFVGALAPGSVDDWLADVTDDGTAPAPSEVGRLLAEASSLAQANHLLAELMPLFASRGDAQALADLTMSELIAAPASECTTWGLSARQVNHLLNTLIKSLTARLLRQILRPVVFREGQENVLAALRRVTVADLLTDLLAIPDARGKRLQPRSIKAIYVRNGLRDGMTQTLESVARTEGVTRERVRQLEQKAYEHLNDPSCRPMTQALGGFVRLAVEACDGVATLAAATARLGAAVPFGDLDPESAMRFLVRWRPNVTMTSDSLLIALPYTEALVRQTQQVIRDAVLMRHDMARDDLIAEASATGGADVTAAGATFVAAVIETMSDVAAQDERYQPVGKGSLKSRIVQAMRSLGHPAHFSEIAAEYRRLFPQEEVRTDNSIHAVFSRFEDTFVLVGNGAFALAEWGYDPRIKNIPALVEHILEQSDRPLYQDEVIARAMERYQWKSISAQLANNPRIKSFGNGFFGLRERDYGAFDSSSAYVDLFGAEKPPKEWLVIGTYTNAQGHSVVRLRLSPACLGGNIQLSNKPLREMFPEMGKFRATVWMSGGATLDLLLTCSSYDVSGFRPLFAATDAGAGDALFVERLLDDLVSEAPAYRLAVAPASDLGGARRAVGLGSTAGGAYAGDITVLHYTRKPHKIISLIEHALEHPWMSLPAVNAALNCVPNNPAGAEYLRLALATGMAATGRPALRDTPIVRPTALGRAWAFSPGKLLDRGRQIALSLPAYRAHVRSLCSSDAQADSASDEVRRIGQEVIASWDRMCGFTTPQTACKALEQSAAHIPTDMLGGPALPMLLLLLVAQTQGQGLSLRAIDAALSGRASEALDRLHALGLSLAEDDLGRIALAELVNLALVSPWNVEYALATSEGSASVALAQAWRGTLAPASAHHTLHMSNLYNELRMIGSDLLYDALVTPPTATPEYARYVDAEAPFCGFPLLAADWAMADSELPGPDTPPLETIVSYTCRGDRQANLPPVGVALCDELIAQPWEVERHLAGNAHLALLTVIAADEGNLAERLRRSDAGWLLDSMPLIPAFDALLRSLGYDPWDEHYREDADRKIRLGRELVALAERLNLIQVNDARLEAVGGVATRVYYDACGRGFTDRISVVLSALPVRA